MKKEKTKGMLNRDHHSRPAVPGKLQHGRIEMADITMCTQTLCPNWKHCYRAQAKPRSWQSMATFDYTISVRGVECDNYMPIYRTVATDSAGHNTEVSGGRSTSAGLAGKHAT